MHASLPAAAEGAARVERRRSRRYFPTLRSTPSGDAYAASELEDMGKRAGFGRVLTKPAEPTTESLVWFEI